MVGHLPSYSHHNMSQQVAWLFPTKSNGFAPSSWFVAVLAHIAMLKHGNGVL